MWWNTVSVVVSGACQVGDRAGGDGGAMKSPDIAVSGLRKAYGDKVVLDGISFDVAAGSVFSMLGPNGAGKTTTERFDLTEPADTLTSAYSGGMRRKLDLAMTLVGSPRIIFLDEPTTGLDPRSRRTMWQIVRELVADGTTIFLTTQYLEEADQLAGQIAVLDQGRVVAQGTPEQLKRQVPGTHVRLRFASLPELDAAARALPGSTRDDQELTLRVPGNGDSKSLRALLDRLDEYTISAQEFSVHTPDLDDVFLALTGHANTKVTAQ
jgi:ABC-2 type transport system ATP-binding protein